MIPAIVLSGIISTSVFTSSAYAYTSDTPAFSNTDSNSQIDGFLYDEAYNWLYNHINYPNLDDEEKQNIIEEYLSLSEFIAQFQEDRTEALNTITIKLEINDRILKEQSQEMLRGVFNNGNTYSCIVDTTIVQEQNTWCGVASTLMALTGISTHDINDLISNYSQPSQSEISTNVIPSGENTAYVGLIQKYLNTQLKSDADNHYTYTYVSNATNVSTVTNYIKSSLAAERPVILRAAPYGILSYYNGCGISSSSLHYLVIDRYDRITDTYWVADCTYLSYYQGRHYNVSASEIKQCVEGSYIIHA